MLGTLFAQTYGKKDKKIFLMRGLIKNFIFLLLLSLFLSIPYVFFSALKANGPTQAQPPHTHSGPSLTRENSRSDEDKFFDAEDTLPSTKINQTEHKKRAGLVDTVKQWFQGKPKSEEALPESLLPTRDALLGLVGHPKKSQELKTIRKNLEQARSEKEIHKMIEQLRKKISRRLKSLKQYEEIALEDQKERHKKLSEKMASLNSVIKQTQQNLHDRESIQNFLFEEYKSLEGLFSESEKFTTFLSRRIQRIKQVVYHAGGKSIKTLSLNFYQNLQTLKQYDQSMTESVFAALSTSGTSAAEILRALQTARQLWEAYVPKKTETQSIKGLCLQILNAVRIKPPPDRQTFIIFLEKYQE